MSYYGPHPNAKRRGSRWTTEDDYRLWKLLEAGTSHRQIAIALGRTTEVIKVRAAALRRLRRQEVA